MLVYVMGSDGIFPPDQGYLSTIPQAAITQALGCRWGRLLRRSGASYENKAPSHIERQRHRRKGRPALAARPSEVKAQVKVQPTSAPTKADRKAGKKKKQKAQGDLWGTDVPADQRRRKVTNLSDYLADRRNGGSRY